MGERGMEQGSWMVTSRQRCDLEMLMIGAFAPLSGFLSQADYENVLLNNRLINGCLWPIPITLDVNEAFAANVNVDDEIALCDTDNAVLARMRVSDKWQ